MKIRSSDIILRLYTVWVFFLICGVFSTEALASITSLEKDEKGHWMLVADGDDYFVRGVEYRVSKVGQSPDKGSLKDWASYDDDHDGKCDPAYESWVDANGNGRRDAEEPVVGDFELLRQMGANTIRWYHNSFRDQETPKEILRDLFKTYGIRVGVGDLFGAYTVGSGAAWGDGTNYQDPIQKQRMLASVEKMVLTHKDEPYTLLWVLGNENNLSFTNTNAAKFPESYAQFLNEAAQLIHRLDGNHPVAFVNGDTRFIRVYKEYCPDVDIFGVNCYRGPKGFGSLWKEVSSTLGKPVLVTEYGGAQAHGADEAAQAEYHRNCWLDLWANRAGNGAGNSIGGFAFEWNDEWWKAGDPAVQAPPGTEGKQGVSKNAKWTQEYCGLTGQGDGRQSPFLRKLRKVYFTYRELWAKKS